MVRRALTVAAFALAAAAPARADFFDDVRRTFQKDIPRTFEQDIPRAFGATPRKTPPEPSRSVTVKPEAGPQDARRR